MSDDIEVLQAATDATGLGIEPPPAARRLAALAQQHGWTALTTYAKARMPDGEIRESVAVRMRRGAGEPRWTAVWHRRDRTASAGKWAFGSATSTNLKRLGAQEIQRHITQGERA